MINSKKIEIRADRQFKDEEVIALYKILNWSSAEKPAQLIQALRNSHTLLLAYYEDRLIGLGNAISDGYLVVYYPHLCVHPAFQGHGVGRMIMERFLEIYGDFHQQVLVADGDSVEFYKKCGFYPAGHTETVWIYQGNEH